MHCDVGEGLGASRALFMGGACFTRFLEASRLDGRPACVSLSGDPAAEVAAAKPSRVVPRNGRAIHSMLASTRLATEEFCSYTRQTRSVRTFFFFRTRLHNCFCHLKLERLLHAPSSRPHVCPHRKAGHDKRLPCVDLARTRLE